jgi:hypothetical protein
MKKPYYPEIPTMTIQATADELVALGGLVTEYLTQFESLPNKSKDLLELIALLRSFQGRLVSHVQNSPLLSSGPKEVRR